MNNLNNDVSKPWRIGSGVQNKLENSGIIIAFPQLALNIMGLKLKLST